MNGIDSINCIFSFVHHDVVVGVTVLRKNQHFRLPPVLGIVPKINLKFFTQQILDFNNPLV